MATGAELDINTKASAMQMADTIFGDSIQILRAHYIGDRVSSGIWTGGDSIAPGLTPSDTGVILSTGRVTGVTQSSGDPNRSGSTSANTRGPDNLPDFNAVAGTRTFDAAVLEVDFIPDADRLSMQFTFASEEYPEFSGSIFNDVVAIWINGELVASPVFDITRINSINQSQNEALFVDNTQDQHNTEMDGFTVTLRALMNVRPGEVNTLRFGIADVSDSLYDSALLVAGKSIQGSFIADDDVLRMIQGQTETLDVLANDGTGGVMTVTHINGQEVAVGGSVTLSSGHVITLQSDGTLGVAAPKDLGLEYDSHFIDFTYTAQNAAGISDTAFVSITTIPCFVRGTMILTTRGEVPVQDLSAGDLVETRDHGAQPIRWIGTRKVAAEGRFAPVVIEAGTFGAHGKLWLSPQHRVMIRHHMAELLFGEDEVLVAAKDLVNQCSVRIVSGGTVEYYHLLFDTHQMIWSNGLLSESFFPGPQTLSSFDGPVQDELFALFPALDPKTGAGYGLSARPGLKSYEARALFA